MKTTEIQIVRPLIDDHMKREYRKWWYEQSKNDMPTRIKNKRMKRKKIEKFENQKKFRILRARLHNIKMEIRDAPWLKENYGERIKNPDFDEKYYREIAKNLSRYNTSWADRVNKEIDEIVKGIKKLEETENGKK